ncbi:MAG TPA: hypothetical protein VF665_18815 [Longimicrobium sp.]|jgi:hypothetical protein|uniref:hypothetical protein n=1 Tax=Longimicrobium sp. TaxID=2029185 RepID=UPI002ED7971B
MQQKLFATPQEAAMSGFSARYCRVVATAVDGDDGYVVVDTGSDGHPYLYGGAVKREAGGWSDGTSGNGDGWISSGDLEEEIGAYALWGEAPAGADAVRARWRGDVRETLIEHGVYLVAWWRVPCPEDDYPSVTEFRIDGNWVTAARSPLLDKYRPPSSH